MEEWRDIEDYKGLYQISSYGRVKSLERTVWDNRGYYRTVPEKIRKPQNNGRGYLYVALHKDGKSKNYLVHRLVACAFIPNPQSLPCLNHKDEDKYNNHMDNLEYCSYSYNTNYGTRNLRASEKLKGRKPSEETVKKIVDKIRGRKHSEETKKKMSEKHKGRKHSEEQTRKIAEKHCKAVIATNKVTGQTIEFPSAMEAERQLGINHSSIAQCCKGGRYKSAGGYVWQYKD